MIEDTITLDKPDIKLIDEDKTVTISLYTYNHLLNESFKLQNAKALYDVTKEKLDNLYNYLTLDKDLYLSDKEMEKIKNIYYGIENTIRDN